MTRAARIAETATLAQRGERREPAAPEDLISADHVRRRPRRSGPRGPYDAEAISPAAPWVERYSAHALERAAAPVCCSAQATICHVSSTSAPRVT